jgi:hypothetical protein
MRRRRRLEPAWQRQGRWCGRALRGLRPDRNPLRRTVDRVETYLLAVLFVVTAAGAPFAAQFASHIGYDSALRTEQAQIASSHLVRATLTQDASAGVNAFTVSEQVPVLATWTSVTGVRHSGEVLAPAASLRGTAVTVWTNAAGDLTSPPLQPSQVRGQGELAATGAVVAVCALCLCGACVIRHTANKRRLSAWAADWAVTSAAWNRQSW